jgi:hypothetical protein
MGQIKITVVTFRFRCDHGKCGRVVEFRTSHQSVARKELRDYGWSYNPRTGRVMCREHRR